MDLRKTIIAVALLGFAGVFTAAEPARASSILEVTVDQAVAKAELIFEGKAVSSRTDLSGKSPYTCFSFDVVDVIKGTWGADQIELCFRGGTTESGMTLTISDLVFPTIGERGVYLVSSLTKRFANPLYGWHQGHYLVRTDARGNDTVSTLRGKAVTGVKSDAKVRGAGISTGRAAGIESKKSARPISLSDFKRSLESISMQDSR